MPKTHDLWSLFIVLGIVAVAGLVGFFIAMWVRRWAAKDEPGAAFTFQDLRDMRARGEITDAEFAAMRNALLGKLDLPGGPPPAPPNRPRPEPPPHPPEDVPGV